MTFNFERRLATFKQFNWPHTVAKTGPKNKYKAQPEEFAQAGFYCRPQQGSTDTVACFLCLKSLEGWEPSDSAWKEHKAHSAACPLVTLHLASSRVRTFERWPGAQVKGGTEALVRAGFYHYPKADGEDTCICFQCGLALDGWEESDDPWFEHARRRPKCPHIAANAYYQPASFDFILDGRPDDDAIKEIDDPRIVYATPRKQISSTHAVASTIKKTSRKITISLKPEASAAPSASTSLAATPTGSARKRRVPAKIDPLTALRSVFPDATPDCLDLSLNDFLQQVIRQNVESFESYVSAL